MAVSLVSVCHGRLSTAIPTNLMEFEAMAMNAASVTSSPLTTTGRFSKLEQPVVSEVLAVYRLRIEIEPGLAEPVHEAGRWFASNEAFESSANGCTEFDSSAATRHVHQPKEMMPYGTTQEGIHPNAVSRSRRDQELVFAERHYPGWSC